MRPRKLQVFLSSTYEDLVDYRLAAMEAILAAGHIPAAMEQFSPGDETAWEKIRNWIDESDAFILILGGRYGSIEPTTGKSYVQLEYEYAVEKKKPHFALVVSKECHDARVREFGLKVDEREHPDLYRSFHKTVTEKLCRFWNDRKDIQAAIFQKLPEWAQRSDLVGWVRGDEAVSPDMAREFARLSEENRELRAQVNQNAEKFHGLTFEEVIAALRARIIVGPLQNGYVHPDHSSWSIKGPLRHTGDLFERLHNELAVDGYWNHHRDYLFNSLSPLRELGLVDLSGGSRFLLTKEGRSFRNRLLGSGDADYRERHFWSVDNPEITPSENDPS
jgi:hypothetical protein